MPPNGGTVRSGRSTHGGCLPVIRWLAGASPGAKPRCDIDFAVFYLFACAAGSPGKKGDATKSGRPRGFAPSLIMLRIRPRLPPSALFTASLARESIESGSFSLKLRLQREHCASPSDRAHETFKLQTSNQGQNPLRQKPEASPQAHSSASIRARWAACSSSVISPWTRYLSSRLSRAGTPAILLELCVISCEL